MQSIVIPYRLAQVFFSRSQLIRYMFSGGLSAFIDVAILYILAIKFGVYYLSAATFAMTISFIIRFLLQKFVTFRNRNTQKEKRQFFYYSILYLVSLFATNLFLFLFVDLAGIPIILSQILAICLIASFSYFIYRFFIFSESK